ncbi:MAG TPA: hypothetical protein VFJ76_03325 [Solirubrobacterales bacterium]|nr:hypothetical protein [Solirubrobacterales bacterium]
MALEDLGKSLQAEPLLKTLERYGVDFVVIGGVAGLAQGSSYPTYDLDVAYARDPTNLRRLADALAEIGVTLRGAPPELPFQLDVQTLANGANFTFDTEFGSFDVLADIAGTKSYEDLRAASRLKRIAGVEVRVASLDDLISMKRAANRVKDQLMVVEYVELAEELRRREGEDADT